MQRNQQYTLPEDIDAELMELSEALEFVETVDRKKRSKKK